MRQVLTAMSERRVTAFTTKLAALLVGLLSVGLASPEPAAAVIDDPDVDTFATYEYRISPEDGTVDVTINLTVTADKPNQSVGNGGYYQYFFEGYFLAIPTEAVDVAVTDGSGRALNFETDDEILEALVLQIDFRRNIFYRETAEVVVTYRLSNGEARGDALTRVNEAYAGFEVWLTPQLEGATVSVSTPLGFDDRSNGETPFVTKTDGGRQLFVAEDVDPETYWSLVSLARDDSLTTSELLIDGHRVELRSWPGDEVWAEHVTTSLEDGLPLLIDKVGLPWPIEDELSIIESYSPYLSGYAGWYDPRTDEIEIGDELDRQLVFHELSHVWFNEQLFRERWITEGLADVFSAAVVTSLGEEAPTPTSTSLNDSAAEPLNSWVKLAADDETEPWSYGASWTVTSAIADEIGLDALSDVLQASAEDEIAYLGDGPAEDRAGPNDWRLYLDLIENRGDVTDTAVTDLFRDWVLGPSQDDLLDVRAESRSSYRELGDAGDGWAPPLAVRSAMAAWRFEEADELLADADAILTMRDQVVQSLAPLDVDLPDDLEQRYESAEQDLTDADTLVTETAAAAQQLVDTDQRITDVAGPLQWVGSIGTDRRSDFAVATDAFESGNLDVAMDRSDAIDRDIEELEQRGLLRIGIALGALILLVFVLWLIRRRRRRRRKPQPVERSMTLEPSVS